MTRPHRDLPTDRRRAALVVIAARVLPGTGSLVVARTETGGSTPVYRMRRGRVTLYLRLAEGPAASLAPEVLAHGLLRERGVRVPEVVEYEPWNEALGRSVMVTTEIPGRSLAEDHRGVDVGRVLVAAGHDVAVLNGVAVAGFGWIRRDEPHPRRLAAALPSLRAFALGELATHLATLSPVLGAATVGAIDRAVMGRDAWLDTGQAGLAHGDLDATHIYHHDGEYTGLIDLGEMRGTDPYYDLGHAALHDGERIPRPLLPHLLTGYAAIRPLPPDHLARIRLWSLLIGVRALARAINRPRSAYQDHLTRAIRAALAALAGLCERRPQATLHQSH